MILTWKKYAQKSNILSKSNTTQHKANAYTYTATFTVQIHSLLKKLKQNTFTIQQQFTYYLLSEMIFLFRKISFALFAIGNLFVAPIIAAATINTNTYTTAQEENESDTASISASTYSTYPPASGDSSILPLVSGRALLALDSNDNSVYNTPINTLDSDRDRDPLEPSAPFVGSSFTGYSPPDAAIEATDSKIIVGVNGRYSLFEKSTQALLDSKSGNSFHRQSGIFDPRLFRDKFTDRVIAVDCSNTKESTSRLAIAVSKDNNPSTLSPSSWTNFYIQSSDLTGATPHWIDFSSLGSDEFNLYIHYNGFSDLRRYVTTRIITVNKAALLQTSVSDNIIKLEFGTEYNHVSVPSVYTRGSFTIQNTDAPGSRVFWVQKSGVGSVRFLNLINRAPGVSPVLELRSIQISIPTPSSSPLVVQKGTVNKVLVTPVFFGNSFLVDNEYLWSIVTVNNLEAAGTNLKWVRFNINNRVVEESGLLVPPTLNGSNGFYFFPAIVVDNAGNVGISAHYSTPEQYISGVSFQRKTTDLPGTMRAPEVLVKGTGALTGTNRYGDYGAGVLDPDGKRMWFTTQVPTGGRGWKMMVTELCPGCGDSGGGGCPECSENAECEPISETCVCKLEYTGPNCMDCIEGYYLNSSTMKCLKCSTCNTNNGSCGDDGSCVCDSQFSGPECESCAAGWYGAECSDKCVPDCLNGGECDDGKLGTGECVCTGNFQVEPSTGLCTKCRENRYTPNCIECPDCNNEGVCNEATEGKCVCEESHTGDNCEMCSANHFGPECKRCPDCQNGGECNAETEGVCECTEEWQGPVCSICVGTVDNENCGTCECGTHGSCNENESSETFVCECDYGFAGLQCQVCATGHVGPACILCEDTQNLNCGSNGMCNTETGKCVCKQGWETSDQTGSGSATVFCNICKEDWYFEMETSTCEPCKHDCGENGECDAEEDGGCECEAGYTGETCTECEEEYFGRECQFCPNCGEHGECKDGKEGDGSCICEKGWKQLSKSVAKEALRADWRSNKGTEGCTVCAEGYQMVSGECVDVKDCDGIDCGDHGVCNSETGICDCDESHTGDKCNKCSDDHFGSKCYDCEMCKGTRCSKAERCVCKPGQRGRFCELCDRRTSPGVACSGNGLCKKGGKCDCSPGWSGEECEICTEGGSGGCSAECSKDCGEHGVCLGGVCLCDKNWVHDSTLDNSETVECNGCKKGFRHSECPKLDCGDNGYFHVRAQRCVCRFGFSGTLCENCRECFIPNPRCQLSKAVAKEGLRP